MPENTEILILRLTVSWASVVGYGTVYRGRIKQVLSGKLPQSEITITVLAGDKEKETFMSAHPDTVEFEMGCHRKGGNEPYPMMDINGFVDERRNSWEIDYLRDAPGFDATIRSGPHSPILKY
jgi:hypothetical protein